MAFEAPSDSGSSHAIAGKVIATHVDTQHFSVVRIETPRNMIRSEETAAVGIVVADGDVLISVCAKVDGATVVVGAAVPLRFGASSKMIVSAPSVGVDEPALLMTKQLSRL